MDDKDERFIGCFIFAAAITIAGIVLLIWMIGESIF